MSDSMFKKTTNIENIAFYVWFVEMLVDNENEPRTQDYKPVYRLDLHSRVICIHQRFKNIKVDIAVFCTAISKS